MYGLDELPKMRHSAEDIGHKKSSTRRSRVQKQNTEPDDNEHVFKQLENEEEDIDDVIRKIEKEFISNRSKSQNRAPNETNNRNYMKSATAEAKNPMRTFDDHL